MVVNTGRYFQRPFKGYQGVTQGDPMYPTIFNVVVNAVIRQWVTVMTPTEAGMGGLDLKIIDLMTYSYANDILVMLTQPKRLQRAFGVPTSLFKRVILHPS